MVGGGSFPCKSLAKFWVSVLDYGLGLWNWEGGVAYPYPYESWETSGLSISVVCGEGGGVAYPYPYESWETSGLSISVVCERGGSVSVSV